MNSAHILSYNSPAANWNEALPLGNGRLGAMVHGYAPVEHIQINEDSLWSGGARDRNNPSAIENLSKIRDLLRHRRIQEAEDLCLDALCGMPENQKHYEPFADLILSVGHSEHAVSPAGPIPASILPDEYARSLDLRDACVRSSYSVSSVSYDRECFISAPADALVVRLTASKPGALFLKTRIRRLGALIPGGCPKAYSYFVDTLSARSDGGVELSGCCGGPDGIGFLAALRVHSSDGDVRLVGETVTIEAASEIVLLVTGCTTFRHRDRAGMKEAVADIFHHAASSSYHELRDRHVAEHRSYYDRVSFSIGSPSTAKSQQGSVETTSSRLDRVKEGSRDPGLLETYFNFGRYLLIASSRPGMLPANLQGIWNDQILPPWDSKYTININTQMNYWPAEITGLPELHETLLAFLERALENGKTTARVMYACRGSCFHHNLDIWGDTAVQGQHIPSAFWPTGAVWFAHHFWDHYLHAPTGTALRRAYAFMKEVALFMLDFLIENDAGELVTSPSVSPENSYILSDGSHAAVCEGPAMDLQMTSVLFRRIVEAERLLGIRDGITAACETALERIPIYKIGSDGRLMEWNEELPEADPGHRHLSHLWGLFPGEDPEFTHSAGRMAAAEASLRHRLTHGSGMTGWSRGWVINLSAFLGRGDEAEMHLYKLLALSTNPNLLDMHPPFQIDGNFGGCAGIANMLLRSSYNEGLPVVLRLLPALPSAWSCGAFRGFRARGGITVNLEWKEGEPSKLALLAVQNRTVRVECGQKWIEIKLNAGISKEMHPIYSNDSII